MDGQQKRESEWERELFAARIVALVTTTTTTTTATAAPTTTTTATTITTTNKNKENSVTELKQRAKAW